MYKVFFGDIHCRPFKNVPSYPKMLQITQPSVSPVILRSIPGNDNVFCSQCNIFARRFSLNASRTLKFYCKYGGRFWNGIYQYP